MQGGNKWVEQEDAHLWKDNKLGDHPVVIVGAGFQLAVLDSKRPSTENIISKTVDECGDKFPKKKGVGSLFKSQNGISDRSVRRIQ